MHQFSPDSEAQIQTLHPKLVQILYTAIQYVDFKVLEGYRTPERGEYLRSKHLSDTGAQSKHCHSPSLAVDVAPFPINWKDDKRFAYLGGFIKGVAASLGIPLRWGGDWDDDGNQLEHSLWDAGHFELKEEL